jgi:hypothetical protein
MINSNFFCNALHGMKPDSNFKGFYIFFLTDLSLVLHREKTYL